MKWFIYIIALAILINFHSASALVQSACGTLSSENTTYDLNQSVSSTGTCFTISRNNITLNLQGKFINYSTSGTVGYGVYLLGTNRSTVLNGSIYEGSTTGSSKHNVYVAAGQNNTIMNLSVIGRGSTIYPFYILGGTTGRNHRIINNFINSTGSNSIALHIASGNNMLVENNTIFYTAGISGIRAGSGYSNYTNNTVYTFPVQVPAMIIYGTFNNTLKSNKFYTNRSQGLWIYSATSLITAMNHSIDSSNLAEGRPINFTFNARNVIYDGQNFAPYGQVIFAWGSNITIRNSNFTDDCLHMAWVNLSVIENSTFNTNTSEAISMYYGSIRNMIRGNFINSTSGNNIIAIGANNGTIYNNTIVSTGAGISNVYIQSSSHNWTINDNYIKADSTSGYGVYIYTDVLQSIINNNIINITQGNGIYFLTRTNRSIANNNIIYAENGYGIRVSTTSCGNCNFNNNTFYVNGTGRGYYAEYGDNTTITNSTFWMTGQGNALFFENTKQTYFENIFINLSQAVSNGINIYTSANFNITGKDIIINEITGASNGGISIRSVTNNGTWTFTNISQSNGTDVKIYIPNGTNGTLNINNYLDVITNYSNGTLASGFMINSTDINGTSKASSITSNGVTRQVLPRYTRVSTKHNYTLTGSDVIHSEDYVATPYPFGTILYFRSRVYQDIFNMRLYGPIRTSQATIASAGGADFKIDLVGTANARLFNGAYFETSWDNITFDNSFTLTPQTNCLFNQTCVRSELQTITYLLNNTYSPITYTYSNYTINASNSTTSQNKTVDMFTNQLVWFTFDVGGEPPVDECAYTSGNYNPPCNCNLSTLINLNKNNFTLQGAGEFRGFRYITNYDKGYVLGGCQVDV